MPAPGKLGSSIVFGKIALASDTADIATLEKTLKSIIRDVGYPEQEVSEKIPDIDELLKEELEREKSNTLKERQEAKVEERDRRPWMQK